MKRFSQFVESFDKPYPANLKKSSTGYEATSILDDGSKLVVEFRDIEDGDWELIFYRGTSAKLSTDKTGEGDAHRVIATVLSATQQFLKKETPENIMFSAEKDKDKDSSILGSREKLYIRLVKRFAAKYGFLSKVKNSRMGTVIWMGRV